MNRRLLDCSGASSSAGMMSWGAAVCASHVAPLSNCLAICISPPPFFQRWRSVAPLTLVRLECGMAEQITPETRSRMMSGIRGKNTQPEMTVRSFLHRNGFRFRLHGRELEPRCLTNSQATHLRRVVVDGDESWPEIQKELHRAAAGMQVVEINASKNSGKLDYRAHAETGLNVRQADDQRCGTCRNAGSLAAG